MAVLTTGSAGSHLGERAFSPCLGGLAIRRSGMERSRRRRALVEWSGAVGKVASQAARSAELCHESRAEWRCEAGCWPHGPLGERDGRVSARWYVRRR